MSAQRRTTLKDIAVRAGVHQTTVSMALRNRPELPTATRQRLQALAEEMGYRPDPALRALRACRRPSAIRGSKYSIAFLTAMETPNKWRESETYVRNFQGIKERATQLGYDVEEFWFDEEGMTGKRATQILRARNISGVLFSGARRQKVLDFDWPYFACATLTSSLRGLPIPLISNDQYHTIRLAFSQLRQLGYRRIGLAMNSGSDEHVQHIWSVGFLGEQARVPAQERIPPYMPRSLDRREFAAWRRRHQPDVILTIPPNLVLQEWLAQDGVDIPEDLGFASLDCQSATTALSGVYQYPEVAGSKAVDLIAGLIERNDLGWHEHPVEVLIRGKWVHGATTRKCETVSETPKDFVQPGDA